MPKHVATYRVMELPPRAEGGRSVHVSVTNTDGRFVDESKPVIFRATPEALPTLNDFLDALVQGMAWLRRESRALGSSVDLPIEGQDSMQVSLCEAINSNRESDPEWFCIILSRDDEYVADLNALDKSLACRLHRALASGAIECVPNAPALEARHLRVQQRKLRA